MPGGVGFSMANKVENKSCNNLKICYIKSMKETNEILQAIATSWGFASFAAWFAVHGTDVELVKNIVHDAIEVAKSE